MNKEQLQDIFRQPYNAKTWQELLINLFGASEIRQTPSTLTSDTNEKVEGFQLGTLTTTDRYEIGLFAFEIKQGHNLQLNRVGLRSLVRSYTRYNVDAALVIYYDATHWRLSFICDIKEQKTAPKRYTYVFGNSDESYRTASAMLAKLSEVKPTFEQIKAAFSVEALSKDFFKGYKEQYAKFCKYIGGEQKWQRDYVKKMLGRLVFLQFLQKKGWMGCAATQSDWADGDLQYTQKLIKQYSGNDKLLSEILEPLFFDTLNTKRDGDIADPKLGDNIKIPYLNGGLFDKDNLDEIEIDFPYAYFAELMDFFSQYNFTIDENDPNDAEVGIDPEMLGHIFENLLEDNKDKGAFYTPKEIVQYMCRQSLIEYLQSKLGKHTEIENFINDHDTGNRLDGKNYIAANAKAIEELLDNVKICDPAIGSGAFPMGVLNEIFQAKMALDMTLDRAAVKKNIIQNSIYGVDIEQGAVDIARLRFWLSLVVDESEPQPLPNLDYKIMQGNSLLSRYELNMPFDDVFKEYNRGKSDADKMSLDRYRRLVADYTNTSDHTQKADFRKTIEEIKSAFRTELSRGEKEKFAKLKGQIIDLEAPMLFGERTKKEKEDLKKLKVKFAKQEQEQADIVSNKLYEDAFEWRFEFPQLLDDDGNFVGFDIVIGNPPYVSAVSMARDRQVKAAFRVHFPEATGAYDLYVLFLLLGLKISCNVYTWIIPNKLLISDYAKLTKSKLMQSGLINIVDVSVFDVFKSASVYPIIISGSKECKNSELKEYGLEEYDDLLKRKFTEPSKLKSHNDLADYNLILSAGATGFEAQKIKKYVCDKYVDNSIPFTVSGNIDRYLFNNNNVRYMGDKYLSAHITKPETVSEAKWKMWNSPKIIVAGMTKVIEAVYVESSLAIGVGVYAIIDFADIDPYYICGLLNSKYTSYYLTIKFKDKHLAGGYLAINKSTLERLPFDKGEFYDDITELSRKIHMLKLETSTADTTALEAQIDQMVYALYNLTPDEIAIIEK